mmetsp:Transcript_132846/g.230353  ORF Transcript_132846/g.230353 Transcript_132846/m.230353 type:complete len:86 (-) Transcript_132846:692-949(-)
MESELSFNLEAVRSIFRHAWQDGSTKATPDALKCSGQLLRLITVEALHRASKAAADRCIDLEDQDLVIEPEDLEQILFHIVLDVG